MTNKKHDLPALPFYVGDWLKCPEVRALSLEARAIWFDMLCYMWESTERGYLTINGKPIPDKNLAQMLGVDEILLKQILKQLSDFAIYSVRESDGALYSRKMVKDEEIRKIRQKVGSEGGKKSFASKFAQAKSQANAENENEIENEDENRNKLINDVLLRWNEFAKQNNLSQVMKITDKRKSAILSRNAEPEFNLDTIFEQIKKSAFLLGETTSWKVDFDFVFCSRNNYIKILEGKYDGAIKQHTSKGSVQSRLDYKFDPAKVEKRSKELDKLGFD